MKNANRKLNQFLLYFSTIWTVVVIRSLSNWISGGFVFYVICLIAVSILYFLLTNHLWKGTQKKTLINSILIIAAIGFFKMYGQEGESLEVKLVNYYSSLANWIFQSIIAFTLAALLFKKLFFQRGLKNNHEVKIVSDN